MRGNVGSWGLGGVHALNKNLRYIFDVDAGGLQEVAVIITSSSWNLMGCVLIE